MWLSLSWCNGLSYCCAIFYGSPKLLKYRIVHEFVYGFVILFSMWWYNTVQIEIYNDPKSRKMSILKK